MYEVVFNWLSKNQHQSYYSDQSQKEQTARSTNQNVQLDLVLLLIGPKPGVIFLSQSVSVAIAI